MRRHPGHYLAPGKSQRHAQPGPHTTTRPWGRRDWADRDTYRCGHTYWGRFVSTGWLSLKAYVEQPS